MPETWDPWELLRQKLNRMETKLDMILLNQGVAMADLSAITASVSGMTDVQQSAIALLDQLSAEIRANATDQGALNALADQLDANRQALADAIVANTPVVNPSPVVEPVTPAPDAPPEPPPA